MTEKLYKKVFVHVLEIAGPQTRICPIDEDEWGAFWVPSNKLTDPKTPKIPIWQQQVNAIAANLPSVDSELLGEDVARISKVRVICPARLEEEAKQLFDREGVSYPEDWRGTELGKRGGTTEQRSLSATVTIPCSALSAGLVLAMEATGAKVRDGFVVFNNFEYTLKLLVDGRACGWKITQSV